MRAHLESDARQGSTDAELRLENPPPLSPYVAHVWNAFADLASTRQSNGFGPARLSRLEIRVWEMDMGVVLEPWERSAIMRLDALQLSIMNPPKNG